MDTKVYSALPSPHAAVTSLQRKRNWLWGYGLGPLLMGLLIFAHRQPFSRSGRMLFQCASVLLVYGLLMFWQRTDRTVVGTAKPAAKPRLVYIAYPPLGNEMVDKLAASLHDVTPQRVPQGISLTVLPLRNGVSLEDQRN